MNVIEAQFAAVYSLELDDYVITIPKVECMDPEDGQTKVFGDTGGFFCGFRDTNRCESERKRIPIIHHNS